MSNKFMSIVVKLYQMYIDGKLASEFDKDLNKMTNSSELDMLMSHLKDYLPEDIDGKEAQRRTEEMPHEIIEESITASDDVIDMRKAFQLKMSKNGGALGLVRSFVDALETESPEIDDIIGNMQQLVKQEKPSE